MPDVGDIYRCKKIKGDPTSGHWWILVYVDIGEVRYMTATSQVGPFLYKHVKDGTLDPERQPDSAVFIGKKKGVDKDGSSIFTKPTILNCYYSPKSIFRRVFDRRVDRSELGKVGCLPDRHLAQIIPSACCSGTWLHSDIEQVLHTTRGIGGRVDAFYRALR